MPHPSHACPPPRSSSLVVGSENPLSASIGSITPFVLRSRDWKGTWGGQQVTSCRFLLGPGLLRFAERAKHTHLPPPALFPKRHFYF